MIYLYKNSWAKVIHNDVTFIACGWFDFNGHIYDAKEIVNFIVNKYYNHYNNIHADALYFNGNFSIIIETNEQSILLVDRMRSYPIVYFFQNHDLIITDDIMMYRAKFKPNLEIDEERCEQFLCSNYIIGPYTIFKDVYSVQSAESVYIEKASKKINRIQYFIWAPNMRNDILKRDYSKEAKLQDDVFVSVFKRMIDSAPNVHNWIVPLSGGYDSRTIINYLYKLRIKNVICYTYGIQGNVQSEISKQVAEALGYQWYFLDYIKLINDFHKDNNIENYLEYGFNGNSVSSLQDFPAVYGLVKEGVLHENDIFIPGHALDFITGGHLHIDAQLCDSMDAVVSLIKNHFSGFGYYGNRENVFYQLRSLLENYKSPFLQIAETFNWQERQTKFIVNSVKCYEFFGYDWRIPEWDVELISYWEKVGFNSRLDRNMFKEVFKKYLAVDPLQNIPFANDILKKKSISLKGIILGNLPIWMKRIMKKKGWYKSMYYAGEGSHLIYSDYVLSIIDYIHSFPAPYCVVNYLEPYYIRQPLSHFEVNSVSSLLIVKRSIS